MWELHPTLENVTPSFPTTPYKSWGPVKPYFPFQKFGWRLKPPCRKGGGGAHYVGREHKMENGDENT